jgi:hypothetical protein
LEYIKNEYKNPVKYRINTNNKIKINYSLIFTSERSEEENKRRSMFTHWKKVAGN